MTVEPACGHDEPDGSNECPFCCGCIVCCACDEPDEPEGSDDDQAKCWRCGTPEAQWDDDDHSDCPEPEEY